MYMKAIVIKSPYWEKILTGEKQGRKYKIFIMIRKTLLDMIKIKFKTS